MSARGALQVIEVREPCPKSWDEMFGDSQTRFCGHCQRQVHNLSAMSADEAERLVCESAGNLCVRFERASDGRVVTLDYQPLAPGNRRWRLWVVLGGCIAALAAVADAVVGFQKPSRPSGVVVGACLPRTTYVAPSTGATPTTTSATPPSSTTRIAPRVPRGQGRQEDGDQ